MNVLALLKLPFQALNVVTEFGEAAGYRNLVDEEDGPDGDPGGQEKMEVFHDNSFAATEFSAVGCASAARRSSSNS